MGKIYTILKDFREIPIGIILWIIFDFKMAIMLVMAYLIGELIWNASWALKRYRPTVIYIDTTPDVVVFKEKEETNTL